MVRLAIAAIRREAKAIAEKHELVTAKSLAQKMCVTPANVNNYLNSVEELRVLVDTLNKSVDPARKRIPGKAHDVLMMRYAQAVEALQKNGLVITLPRLVALLRSDSYCPNERTVSMWLIRNMPDVRPVPMHLVRTRRRLTLLRWVVAQRRQKEQNLSITSLALALDADRAKLHKLLRNNPELRRELEI